MIVPALSSFLADRAVWCGGARRLALTLVLALSVAALSCAAPAPARAQDDPFPLPADLYLLTADFHVLRVDAATGAQEFVVPLEQLVADFAIAPDGAWIAYRTQDGALIVSALDGNSGFVVEFGVAAPVGSAAPTLAWSPDGARLAYIVPGDGVRITALGAGDYGESVTRTAGGAFVALRWAGVRTVVAQDGSGDTYQITDEDGALLVERRAEPPAAPEAITSTLADDGVRLETTVIPNTAGALAYDWAPAGPPRAAGAPLPADLFFLAADARDVVQLWVAPRSGDPVRPVTAETRDVAAYALAADRLAYAVGSALIVANRDGTGRQVVSDQLALAERDRLGLDWSPDGTRLAYTDAAGLFVSEATPGAEPRLLQAHRRGENQQEIGNIRYYFDPRWSPEGSRILTGVGLYEGAMLAVVDVASGQAVELPGGPGRGRWTVDGRVVTWSWFFAYEQPGMYLLNPSAPDADPVTLLDESLPVVDVARLADGAWRALVATSPDMGPQFLRLYGAPRLDAPFARLFDDPLAGGFAEQARLIVPGDPLDGPPMAAGLRGGAWDDRGRLAGALVVVDLQTGTTLALETPGPVFDLRWG